MSYPRRKFDIVSQDDPDRSSKLAGLCARMAYENRGDDIIILSIGELCSYADYFVVVTSSSSAMGRGICNDCEVAMKACGVHKLGVEGGRDDGWHLIDFGDIIVQVFDSEAREYYQLDDLWADAPRLNWEKICGPVLNSDGED